MTDSDIQFLGNWNAKQASSNTAFVSAIVLTPMDGTGPRTISRSQTSLVHIGRIPASDADNNARQAAADESACFTNPVMSRNHAKITFADSGSAFIIDTNSHHGTWVGRPKSANSSIRLAAESPYMLLDGDRVTFGKEVTKNGVVHQPLTVTIKLLRTNSTTPSSPMMSIDTSSEKNYSPKPRNRFGLHPSSDSDSSDNEEENDNPCPGSNSTLDLPSKRTRAGRSKSPERGSRIFALDSPSSQSSIVSSPSSTHHKSMTPQHSPTQHVSHPSDPPDTVFANVPRGDSPSPELQASGLELSGIGSQPKNSANASAILRMTTTTPPWRRAGTLLSVGSLFDTGAGPSEHSPRHLGRLLNPLWMGSTQMVTNGEMSIQSGPSRGARLLSGVGLFNRFKGRGDELVKEYNHEMHGVSHERDLHGGIHGTDRNSHIQYKEASVAIDEDEPVLKATHEKLCTRVEELSRQLTVVQDTIHSSKDASLDQIVNLRSTLDALETAVSALQADVAIVQADISTGRVDTSVLRVDLATLRTVCESDVTAMKESTTTHGTDIKLLRDDLANLQGGVSDITRSLETVAGDVGAMRVTYGGTRDDVFRLQGDLVRIDDMAKKLSRNLEVWEETLSHRIREEVHQVLNEMQSLLGKRKRGHEGVEDEGPAIVVSAQSRPSKRLRAMADFAAAGVAGAFGAYLGLAYLQL